MKYRKKPIVIDAIQLTPLNAKEIKDFCGEQCTLAYARIEPHNGLLKATVRIYTLEGDMTATIGDYIIKGVKGEFYPCKPDIFEKTYELAEQP